MNKIPLWLALLLLLLAAAVPASAQNNLAAGDLAIVSYQADLDPSNTGNPAVAEFEDRFSIVVLRTGGIAAGTVIYFTDRGWDAANGTWLDQTFQPSRSPALGNENVIKWVVPAGMNQGTEVYFINKYHDEAATPYYEWNAYTNEAGTSLSGTVTTETPLFDGGMALATSGDEVLVYQTGPTAGPTGGYNNTTIRFITGLLANVVSGSTTYAGWDAAPATLNESSLPPGLAAGTTAFVMSPGPLPGTSSATLEPDNGKYNCTGASAGCPSGLAAAIYNPANWTYNNNVFAAGASSSVCSYSITAIAVTNPATSTGSVNTPFSQTFTASGGSGSKTFTTSSTLPTNFTLNPNGTLSGFTTQSGTFQIVVTATDAAGCTGTSATYNLVISSGPPGAALNFDGTDDYVSLGTTAVVRPANGLTMEVMVYNANWAVSQSGKTIAGNTESGGYELYYPSAGLLSGLVRRNGGYGVVSASTAGLTAGWHHFALTYDGRYTRLYVDGSPVSTDDAGAVYPIAYNATAPLIIGADASSTATPESGTYFNGSFDELRIWNLARNCDQISQLRNCELTGSESGLVAYYRFNQGVAGSNNAGITTLNDASASGINGTLNNFTLNGPTSNWVTPGGVTSGVACTPFTAPEIGVLGNAVAINTSSATPSTADHTAFGTGTFSRTFTIENSGNSVLNIAGISLSGANASDFTITGAPASVAAAVGATPGTATFTVLFSPKAASLRTATVTINNNDCDEGVYTFAISGTGVAGAALAFDGVNDFVQVPSATANNFDRTQDFTVSLKVKVPATTQPYLNNSDNSIIEKWNGAGSQGYPFVIRYINTGANLGRILVARYNGNALNNLASIISTVTVNDDAWHHVSMVKRGPTIYLFVDGQPAGSVADLTAGTTANSSDLYFGRRGVVVNDANYFKGTLDEVRIYSRGLCQDELQAAMNCELAGTESGLTAYYKFNQGVAGGDNSATGTNITSVTDATANANSGTLNNFARTGTVSNFVTPGGVVSGVSCAPFLAPEIDVTGNSAPIAAGSTTPTTANHTDFGSVTIGGNLVRTFTIQNTGTANLTISGITKSGTGVAAFSVGALTPASPLAPNGTATFTVTFAPASAGSYTAAISIANNDCDEASYDFAIQGTGVCPPVSVTPTNDQTLCNGDATAAVNFTGSPAGTIFSWTNDKPSIGLPASGTASVPSFNAVNNTTAPVTATIIVTPQNGSCTGTPDTFTITVNPTPVITKPGTLYGTTNGGLLFKVNVATGAGTLVGTMPSGATEIEYDNLTGRAFIQLPDGNFSYQEIDTGTAAGIGPAFFDGASFNGLEYIGGVLYGTAITGSAGPATFRILNTATAASTVIGNTGTGPISGLAYDVSSGILYGIGGAAGPAALYTINMATGTATLVGSTGFQAGSLEFGPDGNLYGGGTGPNAGKIFRINKATGAATLVGQTGLSGGVTGLTLVEPALRYCHGEPTSPITFSTPTTGGTIAYNWTNSDPSIGLGASGSGDIASFTATNTGTAPVTATIIVTPAFTNNGVTCSGTPVTYTITVNPKPHFTACPGNITTYSTAASCNVPVSYTATAASTPAPSLAYTFTGATPGAGSGTGSGAVFNKGITSVRIIATNTCGADTCNFTVTVLDTVRPVIACAPPVTVASAPDSCGKSITFCSQGSGSLTLYAVNGGGAAGTQDPGAFMTVNPSTGAGAVVGTPVPAAVGLTGMDITSGGTVYAFTANGGSQTDLITINPATGALVSTIGTVTLNGNPIVLTDMAIQPGTNTIYGATNGNQLVTVNATTAAASLIGSPVAAGLLLSIAFAPGGTLYGLQTNGASGLLTINPATGVVLANTPLSINLGTTGLAVHPVTGIVYGSECCTINTPIANRLYTIDPATGQTTLVGSFGGTRRVQDLAFGSSCLYPMPTATDNCTGTIAITGTRSDAQPMTAQFPVGVTTVTWTATDASGNTGTCNQMVTVRDTTRPKAICKSSYTLSLTNGTGTVAPANVDSLSADQCSAISRSVAPNSFTCANAGTNMVTLTVTDTSGNSSSCTSMVVVQQAATGAPITVTPANNIYTGGNPNVIYLGYGPQSATLTATGSGGSGFTYSWSPVGNLSCTSCQSPVFTPTAVGTYTRTVTATNSNGCSVSAPVTICVKDPSYPGSGYKSFYVCHKLTASATPQQLLVTSNLVGSHLTPHPYDQLGPCNSMCGGPALRQAEGSGIQTVPDEVKVYPNPNNGSFTVELPYVEELAEVHITDVQGKLIQSRVVRGDESTRLRFDLQVAPGMYFVLVVNGDHRHQTKVIIQ